MPTPASTDPADHPIRVVQTALGPTLLLDRPRRRNALTLQMWQALGSRAAELAARTPGPVYVTGSGGYFSSGADLDALAHARTGEEDARVFVEAVVSCLLALHTLDREVVAVVEGGAAGGGVEIMAACDRRVAIGSPRLVFPFGHHGMTLDGFTRWSLTEILGHDEAERLVDGRHVVECDEATRLGLFDERHSSLEEFAAAERAAPRPAWRQDAAAHFLQPGEDLAGATARAAAPMLTAFPPHRLAW